MNLCEQADCKVTAEPPTEEEREAAAVLSSTLARGLAREERSGPCICDPCIARIWRPIIAWYGGTAAAVQR